MLSVIYLEYSTYIENFVLFTHISITITSVILLLFFLVFFYIFKFYNRIQIVYTVSFTNTAT